MKNILLNLLDWIYKKKCYFCGSSKESTKMCSNCYEELEHLPPEANRMIGDIEVFCAGEYQEKLQKLIRGLKYHNQRELAYFQAKFMHNYWLKVNKKNDYYQVVPIPLYKKREQKRKYNHMKLVAEEFCKLTGYKLNNELVKRVKDTKPQYRLNKNQRMDNLSNAFEIKQNTKDKERIMLFDDICTTGSTFESIIYELKKHQISDIVCFATTTPNFEH